METLLWKNSPTCVSFSDMSWIQIRNSRDTTGHRIGRRKKPPTNSGHFLFKSKQLLQNPEIRRLSRHETHEATRSLNISYPVFENYVSLN